MALKGKTKSFKEEEENKKGKNTGGSAGINLSSGSAGSKTVTQPVVPGVPRAGNRGQVAGATNSIISQNYGPSKLSAGKAPTAGLSGFAAAGYRAGSSLGRASGSIGGMTAWSPPKPALSYEQAAEAAERLYEEYKRKKTSFDERYGGLEHPELYYGWKQRGKELTALEERYGKMLERMNRSYMDMEVEPTFTFSGTAADVTPYQQQIDQMRGELEDYVAASNGLPDPNYVRQQQTNIARLQAALDTLPAEAKIHAGNMQGALSRTGTNPTSLTQSELPQIPEEERSMLERSLNQIVLGNFSDDVTLLGTVGQFLLGLTGVDVLLDARDLAYDLTHLREVPAWQVLADAVGLIPVIGALKNVDEVAALVKAFRQGENLLGNLGDGARAGSRLALAGAGAAENAGTLNRVSKSFDAAADVTRTGQRLTETGEVVADTAKAAERAVDSTDEVIDSSKGLGYNGSNRFGDIDLKPADLMEELANSGVKYAEEDVLMVTRNSNGDLMWLEVGSDKSGLTHMWKQHGNDFENRGFTRGDLPSLAATLISQKPVDGTVLLTSRGYEAVYMYEGKYYRMAYGTNGFITSLYPLRPSRVFRNKGD